MDVTTVKTAIFGLGRWGKNVARELDRVSTLIGYATTGSEEGRAWAASHLPAARAMTLDEICADSAIEAVAIATPIHTHEDISLALIRAGKHIFVEKPLSSTAEGALSITEAARIQDVTLMTGYVFLYSPVYRALKEHTNGKEIKEVVMRWQKYGTFTEDIASNLQTHHLALALDLCGEPASGTVQRGPGIKSTCDSMEAHLIYDTYSITSIIDRVSQEPMHVIDVHFVDGTSIQWNGTTLLGKNGEVIYSDDREPLKEEMGAFIAAIGGTNEPTIGDFGTRVLRLAERLVAL